MLASSGPDRHHFDRGPLGQSDPLWSYSVQQVARHRLAVLAVALH